MPDPAGGGDTQEAVAESSGQTINDFVRNGLCILRVNTSKRRVVCGTCCKEITSKQAWRHVSAHGTAKGLRQQLQAFLDENLEDAEDDAQEPEMIAGIVTVQGFKCSLCNYGYGNKNSFKAHNHRGCPGNAVPSTLQPQLVGRQRRLVPVEIVDTPATECFNHIQSVSVQAIMALVQEGINGNAPVSADLSIKDAFHAEMKWDTFLVVDGSFDAAMQLKTPKSVALMTACKDWLRGVVNLMWQYDHMLKRALMKVRLVCREMKRNSSFC